MLSYAPGSSVAHRLDPRTKLFVQIAIAIAAFAHTTPRGLLILTAITGIVLVSADLDPRGVLRELRWLLVLTTMGPVFSVLVFGPPWIDLYRAIDPAMASYRVLCLLLVSVAYVRTTPVRDSRAAIEWFIPGRLGRGLGLGVGLVFRLLPVLLADVSRLRMAIDARAGTQRPLHDRIRRLTLGSLRRLFDRVETLTMALQARCLSWNPTTPPLGFEVIDWPALVLAFGLLGWAVV
ncbi:energy-coupling factor transporter transmembrane component T family protein [Halocatena halophila]|uniref:energy-coupling factor transporter transmembrane component T family protein n=1 Tax=Halocatena halophila TaxID=2814576 RepID=UPI002ED0A837